MNILELIKKNPVRYEGIKVQYLRGYPRAAFDMLVIIAIRGRSEFIYPCIRSLKKASRGHNIALAVVEHSHILLHQQVCKDNHVDHLWLECKKDDPFNKSLAFNVGFLCGVKSKYVIFHDVDCLVQRDFFKNLPLKDAVQTFRNNRVIYCNDDLTNKILYDGISVDDLYLGYEGTFTVPGKAPGGSIMVESKLFERVGMYDPELFYGYAPEDQFMWQKLEQFTKVESCDQDIFHLNHPFMGCYNPKLREMNEISKAFTALPKEKKLEIINYKYYGTD